MHFANTLRIAGLLLMVFSLSMLPPILVEEIYRDGSAVPFAYSGLALLAAGLLVWLPFKHKKRELRPRDGFLIVFILWMVVSFAGALPFYLAHLNISFTDAFFETVSGLTTTGSTVLTKLESLPHSMLYYRMQLALLGGLGIIVIAVAILPMLGVGGMQLFRAETTGPNKDNKLTPRIAQTAKNLGLIYLTLIALCSFFFYLGGMNFFDAFTHSISAVSTCGFANYDASFGHFNSSFLRSTCILFMFLGAINFSLHYVVFHTKNLKQYFLDPEFAFYIKLLATYLFGVWFAFIVFQYPYNNHLILDSLFNAVSLSTTTGLITTHFGYWPAYVPLLLLFAAAMGGSAGSTSGGLKVVRLLLLLKQGNREIKRLIHPHARFTIKLGSEPLPSRVIEGVWGFVAIYFAIFTLFLLALLMTESDLMTAYSALLATISNAGPGLGKVIDNFANISNLNKWILSAAMIVGRLEIFTVLVLFSPAYWRS